MALCPLSFQGSAPFRWLSEKTNTSVGARNILFAIMYFFAALVAQHCTLVSRSVGGWAEFQTSIALRLASFFKKELIGISWLIWVEPKAVIPK